MRAEITDISVGKVVYEVKRGEKNRDKNVISNENAGLLLLALDLSEPWSCHQKYKVMDESHSRIFARPDVNGWKIVSLFKAFESVEPALASFEDKSIAYYNITGYFFSSAVAEIIRDSSMGRKVFADSKGVYENGKLEDFVGVFGEIALTTADDLNAEIVEEKDLGDFDYKSKWKSPNWCRAIMARLKASYSKDVKRKKAKPVDSLLEVFGDVYEMKCLFRLL